MQEPHSTGRQRNCPWSSIWYILLATHATFIVWTVIRLIAAIPSPFIPFLPYYYQRTPWYFRPTLGTSVLPRTLSASFLSPASWCAAEHLYTAPILLLRDHQPGKHLAYGSNGPGYRYRLPLVFLQFVGSQILLSLLLKPGTPQVKKTPSNNTTLAWSNVRVTVKNLETSLSQSWYTFLIHRKNQLHCLASGSIDVHIEN